MRNRQGGDEDVFCRTGCADHVCQVCLHTVSMYDYDYAHHITSYHIIYHIISHHIISYHNIRVQRAKIGSRGFHPNQWQSFAQVMRYDTIRYN